MEKDLSAKHSLPGGDTRWATYYMPYPLYMDKGEGAHIVDIDGNTYIDMQNNYTSLVHGHKPREVMKALNNQLGKDIIYGAPSESQYKLGDLLTNRLPGLDKVRFTNSGTEATMMAMRAARAFTKKDVILKMDGGYHGSHDFTEVNITPDLHAEGQPQSRIEKRGVPKCVLDAVMVARYNDLDSVESILKDHSSRIAAIALEPVMNTAGIIPATPEFLHGLRDLADKYGVLLFFDEIVTFRLHEKGFQGKTDVIPDLTALGKMIGGGFAIGAFGGREEIMKVYDPSDPNGFHHSGTFNGHNLTMVAGLASVQMLTQSAIDRIDMLGERLYSGIKSTAEKLGIYENTTRTGSLIYLHWTDKPISSAADVVRWKKSAAELPRLLHMELLNNGVFTANRGLINISTPMTENLIDKVVEAFERSLIKIKPYIEENIPHLLR
jgi:glutamate-1-semialdehyde 2,1-aminomutase